MAQLILGTAGHIDHGKTSLVRALTGVDTDRLPEEKKRGITIDIGFAELQLGEHCLGVVDVPGHERFVRNMLAGATGVDLALLVVAADDSIKPQTREHLEILRLLRLEFGVIAITKSDLVEPDWLELVIEEVRELVAGTFLASSPIIPTSSQTGAGVDEVREHLAAAAEQAAHSARMQRESAPFRLPIDRVFTVTGHGAVVTGSVVSGRTSVGDTLVLQPSGVEVRIRGLQNHDRDVDSISRGQRAAINLGGVRHDEIERGQELSAIGYLQPTQLLTVDLAMLESSRPLKDRTRVRLHLGSAQVLATVRLLTKGPLEPGQKAPVQLTLGEPVTSIWGQPFVIRSESPVMTIGGGNVLSTDAPRLRKPDEIDLALLTDLSAEDPLKRASAAAFFMGFQSWSPIALARAAGVHDVDAAMNWLREAKLIEDIEYSVTRRQPIHRATLDRLAARVEKALERLHDAEPLRSCFPKNQLVHEFDYLQDPALMEQVLKRMQRGKQIVVNERGVALQGRGPKLSKNERALFAQLLEMFRAAGVASPSVKECQDAAAKLKQAVPQLISLAVADGELVEVTGDYYLHREAQEEVIRQLRNQMPSEGMTLSQIRELLGTTRKYAVPLCEHLDAIGVTTRSGDVRVLANGD